MSDFLLIRAATLGAELDLHSEQECLTTALYIDADLNSNERRKIGLLIHNRSGRGKNGFAWLHALYKEVLDITLIETNSVTLRIILPTGAEIECEKCGQK